MLNRGRHRIDGAPAARFTQRLKDLVESAYGLEDSDVESEQAVAPGTSIGSFRFICIKAIAHA
jgi:hypothetical protein